MNIITSYANALWCLTISIKDVCEQ